MTEAERRKGLVAQNHWLLQVEARQFCCRNKICLAPRAAAGHSVRTTGSRTQGPVAGLLAAIASSPLRSKTRRQLRVGCALAPRTCERASIAPWAITRLTVSSVCGRPPFGQVRGLGLGEPAAQLPKNRRVHLPRMWSRIAQADIAPMAFIMASFRYDGWPTFKQ